MIQIIQQLLSNITVSKVIKVIPWIATVIMFFISAHFIKTNKQLNNELVAKQNNIETYQNIVSKNIDKNKILTLDITDLKNQNDKLLLKVDSVMNAKKIAKDKVKYTSIVQQTIKVVKDTVVVLKDSSFTTSVHPNNQTDITVSLKKDSLKVGLDISNDQYVYVYHKREYKNKNKSFFKRLITLDFKKVTVTDYKIYNSNDIIKNDDVRIIESNKE